MSEKTVAIIKPFAQIVLATGIAVATVIVFAFSNFQSKSDAADVKSQSDKDMARIEKTVDRVETKLDRLIEWQRRK